MPSQLEKTVLIAGGAGFIGSHLCEKFLKDDWHVICLDNFFTGQRKNIQHLIENPNFELVRHDIVHPYTAEVSLILNFACPASPVHYQHSPIKTMKTSVIGTMNLLGLAKRTGAKFIQASTSEVYGDPLQHPQTETYWGNVNPIGPRSCYDEGKRAAETLCRDYRAVHGIDTRILRIFNTYGPRMACDDGRVVSNFITQALMGKDITIFGDGSQTRSFCFVSDLVDAIYRSTKSKAFELPINIGNGIEFTMNEIANHVIELTGSNSKTINLELPTDDPKVRRPDLSRASKVLGYEPKVQLRDGLETTINYFKEELLES